MGSRMEQYVDLHEGDFGGPLVPMACRWSGDGTLLTCTPQAPLKARTEYTVHMRGGMMDAAAGMGMSGWGMPMMGASGNHGMGFTFTTG